MKKLVIGITLIFVLVAAFGVYAIAYTNEELDYLITQEESYKYHAHNAAESFRALGYSDDSEVIQLCKQHWNNANNNVKLYKSQYRLIEYERWYTETDVTMMAKVIYAEARGLNRTEQSKVGWCILNRVDKGWGTISQVITAKGQFAYRSSSPATESLKQLSREILKEWVDEKYNMGQGTRTLGADYIYFHGNGKANIFRTSY